VKVFLDANIIIDLLDTSRESSAFSLELFSTITDKNFDMTISEDILTTVYYVTKKSVPRKKLLSFFEMINDEFSILNFKKKIIKKTIKLCQSNSRLDFEDALQAICAGEYKCDIIITNDKKFPVVKVPVKSTKDFLEEYGKK